MFSTTNMALFSLGVGHRKLHYQNELCLISKVTLGISIVLLSGDEKQQKELQQILQSDDITNLESTFKLLKEKNFKKLFKTLSSKLDQMIKMESLPDGHLDDLAELADPKKLTNSLIKTSHTLATHNLSPIQRAELKQIEEGINKYSKTYNDKDEAFNELLQCIFKCPNIKNAFINEIMDYLKPSYQVASKLYQNTLHETQSLEAKEAKEMIRSFSP